MAFYAAESCIVESLKKIKMVQWGKQKSYIFTQCALKAQATAVLERSYDPLQDQVLYANMSQNS